MLGWILRRVYFGDNKKLSLRGVMDFTVKILSLHQGEET